MASSVKKCLNFKSPQRVVCEFLYRSREMKAEKCRKLKEELVQKARLLDQRQAKLEQLEEEIHELKQQVRRLETEKRIQAENTSPVLPDDPPIGTHGYGLRMVRLALALAKAVGLRGAARSLEIVFRWLGSKQIIPHFTTIRNWMQRVGVASLHEPVEPADGTRSTLRRSPRNAWNQAPAKRFVQCTLLHVSGQESSVPPGSKGIPVPPSCVPQWVVK